MSPFLQKHGDVQHFDGNDHPPYCDRHLNDVLHELLDHRCAPREGTSPLLLLCCAQYGFKWQVGLCYDGMHTVAGVVHALLDEMRGTKWVDQVGQCEPVRHGVRRFPGPPASLPRMRLTRGGVERDGWMALQDVMKDLESCLPSGDLKRMCSMLRYKGFGKAHCKMVFASPLGLYTMACIRPWFVSTRRIQQWEAVMCVLRAVHLLTSKEHDKRSLSALRALVVEAVCMVELCFPVAHMDIKLHNLLLLVDNLEFWGKRCCNTAVQFFL